MASEAGKGSKRRPTNRLNFDQNYDRIFGNKDKKLEEKRNDSRNNTNESTK